MYRVVLDLLLKRHMGSILRSVGGLYVAGIVIFCVNGSFACAYNMGVHFISFGAAKISMSYVVK